MSRIYKYPLQLTEQQKINMPTGAKVIHVAVQREAICLWAIVDPDQPVESRSFGILGTGQPDFNPKEMRHLVSVLMSDVTFGWHVFEPSDPKELR